MDIKTIPLNFSWPFHGDLKMHKTFSFSFQLVPRWVAPNVLTFAGFLLTVANFLLLSHYDYDYTAASAVNATAAVVNGGVRNVIPGWLWPVLAVFLFLAYTLGE